MLFFCKHITNFLTCCKSNLIGEVLVNCTKDVTLERLAKRKVELESEIASIEKSCDDCRDVLSGLKVKLYAKFGTNINLENEDD